MDISIFILRYPQAVSQSWGLGVYLDGQCYEFAIALHRLTGWQMVGMMQKIPPNTRFVYIRHAIVRANTGTLHDVRGVVSEQTLGIPFGMTPPYDLRNIDEYALRMTRPVCEPHIERAAQMIEVLWPELAVSASSRCLRIKAFADELEKLSRIHGIWIRSPYATVWPMPIDEDGTEAGYTLKPTIDGQAYMINCRFENR